MPFSETVPDSPEKEDQTPVLQSRLDTLHLKCDPRYSNRIINAKSVASGQTKKPAEERKVYSPWHDTAGKRKPVSRPVPQSNVMWQIPMDLVYDELVEPMWR